jgi:aspartate-semialdehyde dehydrogenase
MNWHPIQNEGFDVAVVGATGAVGEVLLRVLEQRRFPVRRLRLLASGRSEDTTLEFRGSTVTVQRAAPEAFDGAQLAFFAATGGLSKELAPEAAARGAVAIDKSNSFRMNPQVPLVVPEINPQALDAVDEQHRIVACPNCTTIGFVMALAPLRRAAGLRSVIVTTFQAVSGGGRDGMDELETQRRALIAGEPLHAAFFAHPIADNVIALCETMEADGYTTEERKLLHETRKIFDAPHLGVSMTAVRVPVMVGHSAAVLVETERPLSAEDARAALADFPGVRYVDSESGPTPNDVADSDEVLVGRVRKDFDSDRLWLWEVSNNLRKGAATNAVQIAEALAARGKIRPRA